MLKSEDYIELKVLFDHIIEQGWIESHRSGSTGIGKTFEDLLGKAEDNLDAPDFGSIEIKTQDTNAGSNITLFTKAPTSPRRANSTLLMKYRRYR